MSYVRFCHIQCDVKTSPFLIYFLAKTYYRASTGAKNLAIWLAPKKELDLFYHFILQNIQYQLFYLNIQYNKII